MERYNKPDNAGDAAVDRFRNASAGKASDEARVRLKGISDTINVIDKDKLNYTYDKDKNEYVISKKDYDKIYNDAANKKYIENLQVGKGGNIIQTHGYHNASSGKASDEARVKKESKQTWSKWDGEKYNAEFMKESLSEMKRYERNWNFYTKREKQNISPNGIKALRSEISRLQSYADVPASFAANYPNATNAEILKKYEEYLKKNRK